MNVKARLKRGRLKGWGDGKFSRIKPITRYVPIAPTHLNVNQLNLDLKIQGVGRVESGWPYFPVTCKSFRTQ